MIRMVNQVSSVWFNDKLLRKSLHNETNFNKREFTEKFCEFIKSRNVLVGATARVFVHYLINIVSNNAKCHLRMRGWIYWSNHILGASGLKQNWNESDNGCSKRPQLQRKAKPLARLWIIFCETLHLQWRIQIFKRVGTVHLNPKRRDGPGLQFTVWCFCWAIYSYEKTNKKGQSHGIDLCGVQVSFVEWNFNKMGVFSLTLF